MLRAIDLVCFCLVVAEVVHGSDQFIYSRYEIS